MKASSILKHSFLRKSGAVLKLLKKQPADFTHEDFHTLRVHIKHIKVILELIASSCSEFNKTKYFTPYKKLFQLAGKIRELQLQHSAFNIYKADPALNFYNTQLKEREAQASKDFFDLIRKSLFKKLKRYNKKILSFMPAVGPKEIKRQLSRNIQEVEAILQLEKPEKEEYHLLRKKIKSLQFLQKLFLPVKERMILADPFQHLLGQWHDYWLISKDLLKDAQNHKLTPTEVKALMALQKKISNRAARLIEKINSVKSQLSHPASHSSA